MDKIVLLSGLFWSSSALNRDYVFVNTKLSWPDAQSYCREHFTDLATIDGMDDVNRLVKTVVAGYSGSPWIGLTKGTESTWVWSNGERVTSQDFYWYPGEPNQNANCATINSGYWYDTLCTDSRYFVCYDITDSNKYIMVNIGKSWIGAQRYCRQYHTDLVTIHNAQENELLKDMIVQGEHIWIGLYRESWVWSDNWSLFFRDWVSAQAMVSQTMGVCVGMSMGFSGAWLRFDCDLLQPFVCYKDVKRKQVLRLQLSCNGDCGLNDAFQQNTFVNQISASLKNMGLGNESMISWRNGGDYNVVLSNDHVSNDQCCVCC